MESIIPVQIARFWDNSEVWHGKLLWVGTNIREWKFHDAWFACKSPKHAHWLVNLEWKTEMVAVFP